MKEFEQEYKKLRKGHLIEFKMLLTSHSEIRDLTSILHKINMTCYSNATQKEIVIKMHLSEMIKLQAVANEERWLLSQKQKDEIEAFRATSKLTK